MSRYQTRALFTALVLAISPVAFAQNYGGPVYDYRYDPGYATQQYPSEQYRSQQYRSRQYPSDRYPADRYATRNNGGYQNDRVLHDNVHDAIEHTLGNDARSISVSVRGGHVYLAGSVRDQRVRSLAHDVAHDVPGVHGVYVNRLYTQRRYYN